MKPTWELEVFGDGNEIRDADKEWLADMYKSLQKAIFAPEG